MPSFFAGAKKDGSCYPPRDQCSDRVGRILSGSRMTDRGQWPSTMPGCWMIVGPAPIHMGRRNGPERDAQGRCVRVRDEQIRLGCRRGLALLAASAEFEDFVRQ